MIPSLIVNTTISVGSLELYSIPWPPEFDGARLCTLTSNAYVPSPISLRDNARAHYAEVVYQRSGNDEWTVKAAKTVKEATELLSVGFEYATEIEGSSCLKNVNKLVDAL